MFDEKKAVTLSTRPYTAIFDSLVDKGFKLVKIVADSGHEIAKFVKTFPTRKETFILENQGWNREARRTYCKITKKTVVGNFWRPVKILVHDRDGNTVGEFRGTPRAKRLVKRTIQNLYVKHNGKEYRVCKDSKFRNFIVV